jgi:mono/diheme cytochrome c family protein
MPPFVGTVEERHALAVYLARLGGATDEHLAAATTADDPARAYFDDNCAMCHGDGGEWPLAARPPQPADAYYEMLGRLPAINEVMPAFEGNEPLRRALAAHLATLGASRPSGGAQ